MSIAAICAPLAGRAHAYEPQHTHRWLTRQAIEHLLRVEGERYALLREHLEAVVDGCEHEDDIFLDGDSEPTTFRLMRHFYRPTDGAGLSISLGDFPSSLAWGGAGNPDNQWDYQDALEHYRAGELDEAFFALGHVVHLVQDATVPAHTHLDDHGPPHGDDYEDWCAGRLTSELTGDLPLPPPDAPVPVFASVEEAWQLTARASYWRNMVPGRLSRPEIGRASGVIARMFPDIEVDLTRDWSIPGIGELGSAFLEEADDRYYFARLMRAGEVDRAGFDPYAPEELAYAANPGRLLVENMAADLVPLAVLHSAGTMKMFLDEAAALAPPPADDPTTTTADAEAGGCSAAGAPPACSPLFLFLACLLLRRNRPC